VRSRSTLTATHLSEEVALLGGERLGRGPTALARGCGRLCRAAGLEAASLVAQLAGELVSVPRDNRFLPALHALRPAASDTFRIVLSAGRAEALDACTAEQVAALGAAIARPGTVEEEKRSDGAAVGAACRISHSQL
jgi:hypothetical protein